MSTLSKNLTCHHHPCDIFVRITVTFWQSCSLMEHGTWEMILEPSQMVSTSSLEILWRPNKNKSERQCCSNGAQGPPSPYSLTLYCQSQTGLFAFASDWSFLSSLWWCPCSTKLSYKRAANSFHFNVVFPRVSRLFSMEALLTFHFLKESSTKWCPHACFPSASVLKSTYFAPIMLVTFKYVPHLPSILCLSHPFQHELYEVRHLCLP